MPSIQYNDSIVNYYKAHYVTKPLIIRIVQAVVLLEYMFCPLFAGTCLKYKSGTDHGSSGAPVLKVIDGEFEIVALHKGYKSAYNYGNLFSEILKHIRQKKSVCYFSVLCTYVCTACTCIHAIRVFCNMYHTVLL